eukprot:513316-Amphidinium_carterae.1
MAASLSSEECTHAKLVISCGIASGSRGTTAAQVADTNATLSTLTTASDLQAGKKEVEMQRTKFRALDILSQCDPIDMQNTNQCARH